MRENIAKSIERIVKKGFDFVAGDLVILVLPDGTEKSLLTIQYTDARLKAEGLDVFFAGTEDQEERVLLFLRSYLIAQGISNIPSNAYIKINGQRWDLSINRPIVVHGGTSETSSHVVYVWIRKAIESTHSVPGTDFTFNLG